MRLRRASSSSALGRVVVLSAVFLSALAALPRALGEVMETTNEMNDASDMLEDFARYEMDAATMDLFNATTGEPLSDRSKAVVADADPEDPDDFDLGLFVDKKDADLAPGSTVDVSVCDFKYPENCEKATPYKGAPESYECGESDEADPRAGFECLVRRAVVDDDGDLSHIDLNVEMPTTTCDASDAAVTKPDGAARRMLQVTPGRRRRRSSRSVRTAGVRGYRRGGTRRRGGARG